MTEDVADHQDTLLRLLTGGGGGEGGREGEGGGRGREGARDEEGRTPDHSQSSCVYPVLACNGVHQAM